MYKIMKATVINGPNLNMLGVREPHTYGHTTLEELHSLCINWGAEFGVQVECFQSNHEGAIVDKIQSVCTQSDAILINAGAYTHTSVAIRDALLVSDLPVYEIHISNIYAREDFRHHSRISDIAVAVLCGFGVYGYEYALRSVAKRV